MSAALLAYRRDESISQEQLGARIRASKVDVSRWETGARRIPAERVLEIEAATQIPRSELRPDLYPAATEAAE